MTVVAAQNNDRQAYDQLIRWQDEKTFRFSKQAEQARSKILDEYASPFHSLYQVTWQQGVDPSKLSFDRLKKNFYAPETIPQTRASLIQYIWDRGDITKKDKMEFLVEVMKTDPSLQVVGQAGRCFLSESKQQIKPLVIDKMIDWWEKHKNEYLTEAQSKDPNDKK